MTPEEFEQVLEAATHRLTDKMRNSEPCQSSKQFEKLVLTELRRLCRKQDESANPAFHQHAFPDLVVNGFGVEVKHTTKDSWLAIGNSIFEGMRDPDAKLIYVVYGKMGGWPEVRWSRYEDCVTHVRISHAPRFVIEMDDPNPFFRTIGITYEKFARLSPSEKMNHVRKYARNRLRKGEQLWWLEDLEEPTHALPVTITFYRYLSNDEKRKLRAEMLLLCPEILQGSHARDKYERAALYSIMRRGIFASRDLFTAGSVGAKGGKRGHKYIIDSTRDIEPEMTQAAEELDDALFIRYWGKSCPPNKRISTWLKMADEYADGWTPSKRLFKNR